MSGTPSTLTQKGITALKAGNRHLAKQFLQAALAENPNDATAWLWMSGVATTVEEKRECLRRVLAIDPNHALAKRGLEALGPEPNRSFVTESVDELAPLSPAPPTPTPPRPAARKIAAPPPPVASRPARRAQTAALVVLLAGVIAVAGLIVALLASQAPQQVVSGPAQPIATSARPPTWTPTPTATPTPRPTPRPAPTQLQPLVAEAIRIRELEPIESIHYVLSAQFDLDLYLRNDLDAQSTVFANAFWQEMRALGLVSFEVEFDRQLLIDVSSQQLGGFYSPGDKTLYAVTRSSRIEPGEYPVIVHEYAHALSDMHFDLGRLYRMGQVATDADLAARALGEGDASLVENSSKWGNYGPQGWEQYARDARWAAPLFRRAGVSPALLYIQSFPYVEGWQFVWALRESGGWPAVNQAYANPPASTEQILHPDRYLAGSDPPQAVTLPEVDGLARAGYTIAASDTLGEYVLSLLLDEFLDDTPRAARAAAGWGGDALGVWSNSAGRQAYVLLTAWDSEEDAREFVSAAAVMLAARAGGDRPAGSAAETIYFDGDEGSAYLSRNADQVLIVWCARPDLRDAILSAFPDF